MRCESRLKPYDSSQFPAASRIQSGRTAIGVVGLLLLFAGSASAETAPVGDNSVPVAITHLTVEPAEIVLHAANRQQQLLVTGRCADGKLVDLTRQAQFSTENAAVVRMARSAAVGLAD